MDDMQCFYSSSHSLDGSFGRKNNEILYSKSQSQSQSASEKVLQEYNYYILVLFFDLPVKMYHWNRLLDYMNLSHHQCSHSHVSEVIKMITHDHRIREY